MATSGSDQLNIENLKLGDNENNQQAVDGDGQPKTAKQLAKEAEKAEKLRKFQEKQKAKEEAEKQVLLIIFNKYFIFKIFFQKKEKASAGNETGKARVPDITAYTSPTGVGDKKGLKIKLFHFDILHYFSILQIFIVNYPKVIVQNMSKQLGIIGGKNKVFFVQNITTNIHHQMVLHHEKTLLWLFHHQM